MSKLSRRSLLKQAVLAALAGAVPVRLVANSDRRQAPELAQRLAGCLSHPGSARPVGARYLAGAPGEAHPLLLTALIAGSLHAVRAMAGADRQTLRRLLAARQRSDFASQHIVAVDGWILSRTEARLCALSAMQQGR